MDGRKVTMPHKHMIAQVFVFVLLGVFAVLSTMMVLLSAQLYRGIVRQTEQHSSERILSSYVTNAVHANDAFGMITVENRGGTDMLVMGWEADGQRYETMIYCYDGALRELFASAEQEFDPEYGEIIGDAQSFVPEIRDGLLEVRLTDSAGQEDTLYIALRCGQEAEHE